MLRNRKGMAEVVAVVGMLLIGLCTWLAGPAVIKAVGSLANGGDKNQQKSVHKVDKTRTYFELDEASGKYKPTFVDKTSEYSNELQAEQPPETLWSKFWHLGIMAIVIIVVLSYLGILPIIRIWWNKWVKPKIVQAQAEMENAVVKHDVLESQAIDIAQAIDDGWDAYDAQVKVYTELMNTTIDQTQKLNYMAIVTALTTARKAMKDKIYAELDNASLAKLTELQSAQA